MDDFDSELSRIVKAYDAGQTDELLIRISEYDKDVVIFGSGVIGGNVAHGLRASGRRITAFCDNYKSGMDERFSLPIITPEQLFQDYKNAIIIIAVGPAYTDEINAQLLGMGFQEANIYRRRGYALRSFETMKPHFEGYKWAYDFFTDGVSKRLVLDKIRMHLLGFELSKSSDAPQYFDPELISFNKDEVFVDGGAFTGDTAEAFIHQPGLKNVGGYRHIYCFEPDSAACEKAFKNLKNYSNVDILGKGLWSSDAELSFFSDGGNSSSSFVRGERTTAVPVTSIDSFFSDKPLEDLPTFIKMDIEGAEKEALIGSTSIIKRKHPKLAICAYHKPEDIYELPRLINDIDPSYRFALVQYADGIYDTVLHAV